MRRLLLVLATSFVAHTAVAQKALAPAFLECKTDIGVKYFRIVPDNLSRWYDKDRQWNDFLPCSRGHLIGKVCSFTITDTEYNFDDRSENPESHQKFWSQITIDRVSGVYSQLEYASGLRQQASSVARIGGTCTKTNDPSLKPKPVPAM